MKKEGKKNKYNWLVWIIVGILAYFFFTFLFGGSNNSDKIEELEYKIDNLNSKVNCLNTYINYLQGELKKDPDLVSYSRGDVIGALSIYFPQPSC